MKKKLFASVLSTTLLFSATPVFANPVIVDGKKVSDNAYIKNGSTMLEFRTILNSLGIPNENILWDAKTKMITASYGEKVITMQVGSKETVVNGIKKKLSIAPEIMNGKTQVPVRFLNDVTGLNIQWNSSTKTVIISSNNTLPIQNVDLSIQEKAQIEVNSIRDKAVKVQELVFKYAISEGKDGHSLEQLQNLADTIPELSYYDKYKETKQYSAILSGNLTVLNLARFATSLHTINVNYMKGEESLESIEKSKQFADELLESLEIFNNNLKDLKMQSLPEVIIK